MAANLIERTLGSFKCKMHFSVSRTDLFNERNINNRVPRFLICWGLQHRSIKRPFGFWGVTQSAPAGWGYTSTVRVWLVLGRQSSGHKAHLVLVNSGISSSVTHRSWCPWVCCWWSFCQCFTSSGGLRRSCLAKNSSVSWNLPHGNFHVFMVSYMFLYVRNHGVCRPQPKCQQHYINVVTCNYIVNFQIKMHISISCCCLLLIVLLLLIVVFFCS